MQIAFISSAVGIFLSLVLRWKNVSGRARGAASEGRTAGDIYTQLTLLRKESKEGAEQIKQSLDRFAETLAELDGRANGAKETPDQPESRRSPPVRRGEP